MLNQLLLEIYYRFVTHAIHKFSIGRSYSRSGSRHHDRATVRRRVGRSGRDRVSELVRISIQCVHFYSTPVPNRNFAFFRRREYRPDLHFEGAYRHKLRRIYITYLQVTWSEEPRYSDPLTPSYSLQGMLSRWLAYRPHDTPGDL